MSKTITSVAGVLAALLASSCATGAASDTYAAPMISAQPADAAAATPARDATVAKIAAMIDGKVPVMRLAGAASRKSWGEAATGKTRRIPSDSATPAAFLGIRTQSYPVESNRRKL